EKDIYMRAAPDNCNRNTVRLRNTGTEGPMDSVRKTVRAPADCGDVGQTHDLLDTRQRWRADNEYRRARPGPHDPANARPRGQSGVHCRQPDVGFGLVQAQELSDARFDNGGPGSVPSIRAKDFADGAAWGETASSPRAAGFPAARPATAHSSGPRQWLPAPA